MSPLDESEAFPQAALEQAHTNLKNDALRRFLCGKYNMPPTDPRYLGYTPEEAMLEWLEDAVDSGAFIPGLGGKPARKILYKGVEIYSTGSKVFDALERSWADQEPLPGAVPTEFIESEGPDILSEIRSIRKD